MIKERFENGKKVFDVFKYEDYDEFEQIIDKLKLQFSVDVYKKLDGPDSRVWYTRINGFDFLIINNSYGNCIKPVSSESQYFIEKQIKNFNLLLS